MAGRPVLLRRSRVRDAPRYPPRPWNRLRVAWLAVATATLFALAAPRPGPAPAVKGELSAGVDNGHARLVFHLTEEVESQVRFANNVLTIVFARAVDIAVDRLNTTIPDYVSAARRDPDGKALRIALARKVTINSM